MAQRISEIDGFSIEEYKFIMDQTTNINEVAEESDIYTVKNFINLSNSFGVKQQEIQQIFNASSQILTLDNFVRIDEAIKEIKSQILKLRDFEKAMKNSLKNIQLNFLDEMKIVDAAQAIPLISFSAELQKSLPSVNLALFATLCPLFQSLIQNWKTTSNIQEIFKSFQRFIERGLTFQTPKSILFGIKPQDLKDIVQKGLPSISQDNSYESYCQMNDEQKYKRIFQKIDSDFNTLQTTQFNIALEQFKVVSEKYAQLASTNLEVVFSNQIKIIQFKMEQAQNLFKQAKIEENVEVDWKILLQKSIFYKKTILTIDECQKEMDSLEEQIQEQIMKSIDETALSIKNLKLQPIILFSEFFRELLKVVAEVVSPLIIESAIKMLIKNVSLQKSYTRYIRLKFKDNIFDQNQNKVTQSAVKTTIKELCTQYKLSTYLPQIQDLLDILPVWGSPFQRHLTKNEKPSESTNWTSILILQDAICISLSEAAQQKTQDSSQLDYQQKEIQRIWQGIKQEVKEITTMDLFQFEIVEDESQRLRVSRIQNSELKQLYQGEKITLFLCGEDISYELPDLNKQNQQNQRCIMELSDDISFDLVKWLLCDSLDKEEREIILSLFIYFFDEKTGRKQLTYYNLIADFPQYVRLAINTIIQFKDFFQGQLQQFRFCSEVAKISEDQRRNVQQIQQDQNYLQGQQSCNYFQDYYDQSTNELSALFTKDSSGKESLFVFDEQQLSNNYYNQLQNGKQVIKKVEFGSSYLKKIFKKLYSQVIFSSINSETAKTLFYFCQFLQSEDQMIQKKTNPYNNNVVLINQETIINVQKFLSSTSNMIRKHKIEQEQKQEALRIEEENRITREKIEQEKKEKKLLEKQEQERKQAEEKKQKEKEKEQRQLEKQEREKQQTEAKLEKQRLEQIKKLEEAERKRIKDEEEQKKKDQKQEELQRIKEEKLAEEFIKSERKKQQQTKSQTKILNTSKSGKLQQNTISSSSSLSESNKVNQLTQKGQKNQQEDSFFSPLREQTLSHQTSISENISPVQNRENQEYSQNQFVQQQLQINNLIMLFKTYQQFMDAKINELQGAYSNGQNIAKKIESLKQINKTFSPDLEKKIVQEKDNMQQAEYVIKNKIETKEVSIQVSQSSDGVISNDIMLDEGNKKCYEDDTYQNKNSDYQNNQECFDQKNEYQPQSQIITKGKNIPQNKISQSTAAQGQQAQQYKKEVQKSQVISGVSTRKTAAVQVQQINLTSVNQAEQKQTQLMKQMNQTLYNDQDWKLAKGKETPKQQQNNTTTQKNQNEMDIKKKNDFIANNQQNKSFNGAKQLIQKQQQQTLDQNNFAFGSKNNVNSKK